MINMEDWVLIYNLLGDSLLAMWAALSNAVFLQDPRISLLDIMVSLLFLDIMFEFLVWMRSGKTLEVVTKK